MDTIDVDKIHEEISKIRCKESALVDEYYYTIRDLQNDVRNDFTLRGIKNVECDISISNTDDMKAYIQEKYEMHAEKFTSASLCYREAEFLIETSFIKDNYIIERTIPISYSTLSKYSGKAYRARLAYNTLPFLPKLVEAGYELIRKEYKELHGQN